MLLVKDIIESWAKVINPNKEEKELANVRHAICSDCENKKMAMFEYCGLCGCALKGKIFSKEGSCPIKKW
jgi:hypothetical protein